MLKPLSKNDDTAILNLWNCCLPDLQLTDRLLEQNTWQ